MPKKIDFIDLRSQQQRIKPALDSRMAQVLAHGQYILGPEIGELEKKLSTFVGVKHAMLCSSGTDALLLALMALGIGPGDEVVTTPFTFFATGEMVALLGAKPVFADIDPETYNLDPNQVEAKMSSKTKALCPVNLYGQCVDYDVFQKMANQHGVPLIEDAAQSFGATFKGRRSCSFGAVSCTSFFPAKPLGGYGDSGACFTNDDALAEKIRVLLNQGQVTRYFHTAVGINGRCDTLQAAILLAKFDVLEDELRARDRIAAAYTAKIKAAVGSKAKTPTVRSGQVSAWAQYTVEIEKREEVIKRLSELNVPTAVHYPRPLHRQPAFTSLGYEEGTFPLSEKAGQGVMSLPMHPYLSDEDQDYIVESLKKAIG